MAGIYIHIPFCVSKCSYCDFYSIPNTDSHVHNSFLEAIAVEARVRAYELAGERIETIYIGGGTPSLIPAEKIGALLDLLKSLHNVSPDAEVTIECNPGDLSHIDIKRLLEVGINRFSIGAQSFHPQLLKFLTRRHSIEETKNLVKSLKEAGVTNYSVDLIYGIPGETLDMLKADLQHITSLAPTHISAYHLMYEQGTTLTSQLSRGAFCQLSEEDSLNMFSLVNDTLAAAGYEHYEISNYALPGYRSRHNSSYWSGVAYQGLGPSAHSYIHPWRSWNPRSVQSYSTSLHTSGFVVRDFEFITKEMGLMEYVMTRLRTVEGISISYVKNEFGAKAMEEILRNAEPFVRRGQLRLFDDHLALTPTGLPISDSIIEELA